jgi:hypothetical protein
MSKNTATCTFVFGLLEHQLVCKYFRDISMVLKLHPTLLYIAQFFISNNARFARDE